MKKLISLVAIIASAALMPSAMALGTAPSKDVVLGLSEVYWTKYIDIIERELLKLECRRVFAMERDGELLTETQETLPQGYLSDDDEEDLEDCGWKPIPNF